MEENKICAAGQETAKCTDKIQDQAGKTAGSGGMTIEQMLERLKNDESWCSDPAIRARVAGQLMYTIIES